MASGSGDSGKKDRTQEILDGLLAHAAATDQHIAALFAHAKQTDHKIEVLQVALAETNTSVQAVVGAIGDLIDRIPPESLR